MDLSFAISFVVVYALNRIATACRRAKHDPETIAHHSVVRNASGEHEQPARCAPEIIGPPIGNCGVTGCRIKTQHSHVSDLVRRLKERR